MLKYPDSHRVSVDNQGETSKDPRVVIELTSSSQMLVKTVGKSGIVYLPSDWAGTEVIVVRRRKE